MKNLKIFVAIKKNPQFAKPTPEDSHVNVIKITCDECPNYEKNIQQKKADAYIELAEKKGIIIEPETADPQKMFSCATSNNCHSESVRLGHATSIKNMEKEIFVKRNVFFNENKSISSINSTQKFNGAPGHQAMIFPEAQAQPLSTQELSEYHYDAKFSLSINKNINKIEENALPRAAHDHKYNTANAKITHAPQNKPNDPNNNQPLLLSAPKLDETPTLINNTNEINND